MTSHIKRIKEDTIVLLNKVLRDDLLSHEEYETYSSLLESLSNPKDEKELLSIIVAIVEAGNINPDFFNNS